MGNYVPPNQARHLRACMVCSIVQLQSVGLRLKYGQHESWHLRRFFYPTSRLFYQSSSGASLYRGLTNQTLQRFIREGCPNCEFLDLANHPDSVQECTSQVYEGLITLSDPRQSWVARWQRLDQYVPGVYAVKVVGIVSASNTGRGCYWPALHKRDALGAVIFG